MAHLLIELLSEEIPARMQAKAAADLKQRMTDGLVTAGLTYASAGAFHTPRRLTLAVEGLLDAAPAQREERKGPRVDAPEKAVEGFLRSTGLSRDQLTVRDDKKGQVYMAVIETPGRAAETIVAEVLEQVVRNFPWPKSMRWGAGDLRWVRPLQNILCILSDEAGHQVVPLELDGITANNRTRGHRFMAPEEFSVTSFEDYASRLRRAAVVLSAQDRADTIWSDAGNLAFAQGLDLVEDPALLAEVAGLVEFPVVLMGRIDDAFLHLPPEVLQTSMREHQKFFSVKDPKTGQIVRFVTVANRTTADEGATILAGNQKVLSARLSDARFFWDNDLRVARAGIDDWVKGLETVTFHNKLGTQGARVERIAALAAEIAPMVGADPEQAAQAARLAKADLQSAMVGEFPELQGLMGRYYIEQAGFSPDIAAVAQEHYAPLGPSDTVPTAPLSVAVALADKIDLLTGFWAIDEKPTGSKDPFALRRAALGVIRLVLKSEVRFSLRTKFLYGKVFDFIFSLEELRSLTIEINNSTNDIQAQKIASPEAFEGWRNLVEEVQRREAQIQSFGVAVEKVSNADRSAEIEAQQLIAFIHDRLKVYLRDQGIRHDVIDACLAMPGSDDLTLLVKRAQALAAFLKTDDGENLLQGFKRANNILAQAEAKDGVEYSFGADVKYAQDDAEKALFAALDAAEAAITPAMAAEDFATAMGAMAALRAPIDGFFEAVQVNADSALVRRNRLNLLSRIRTICLGVADLTRVEG